LLWAISMKVGITQIENRWVPESWDLEPLGNVINFIGGSQPPLSTFTYSERPGYVRLIQIRDYKSDKNKVYVPRHLARRFCSSTDILIGRYGPPVFQILRGLEGAYNVALIKAVPSEKINSEYAWHFLRNDVLLHFIEKLSQRSSGQTGVDLAELRNYPILLPPLHVQQAIAEALSDADAWIESLETLIEKKRLIKQGAMQELLRPNEGWDVKMLGEVLSFGNGRDYKHLSSGDYPVYGTGGILKYVDSFLYSGESVGIGRKGTIDEPTYLTGKFWCVDTLFYTHSFKDVVPKFIYYTFLQIPWKEFNEASGVPSLSKKTIEQIEIKIPSFNEQMRISTVLSEMDAEIEVLEQKLSKARQIKQGMMQQLLTGQILLVTPTSAKAIKTSKRVTA